MCSIALSLFTHINYRAHPHTTHAQPLALWFVWVSGWLVAVCCVWYKSVFPYTY